MLFFLLSFLSCKLFDIQTDNILLLLEVVLIMLQLLDNKVKEKKKEKKKRKKISMAYLHNVLFFPISPFSLFFFLSIYVSFSDLVSLLTTPSYVVHSVPAWPQLWWHR